MLTEILEDLGDIIEKLRRRFTPYKKKVSTKGKLAGINLTKEKRVILKKISFIHFLFVLINTALVSILFCILKQIYVSFTVHFCLVRYSFSLNTF